jgi:hypothetical protein
MAQHDGVIDNGPGLAVRTDINAALQALLTQNSGPVEPTTKYAGMLWLDTSVAPDGMLRQRNQANTAWIAPQVLPTGYGNIVQTVVTTSGAYTYSKAAGLKFLEVEIQGAGGGGAPSVSAGASQMAVGGGGGAGGRAIKLFRAEDLPATVNYTVGAAGGNGAAGGTTTFSSPTPVTATGGSAGTSSAAGSGAQVGSGGVGGAGSGGEVNGTGQQGNNGFCAQATIGIQVRGNGASSPYGGGGLGAQTSGTSAGQAATGFGAGGSGAGTGASGASQVGGAGSAAFIRLKEYF